MLNNINFLLNSVSTREFVLVIVAIMVLFGAKTYSDLMPKAIAYDNSNKILINKNKLLSKYKFLLKQQDSKDDLLNQKKDMINKGKAISGNDINTSQYFDNFKNLYLWMCNIENKYQIKTAAIKHTDIQGLIQVDIFATLAKVKPKKCVIKENINLKNVFFTEKIIVFSIIGNRAKINDLWYLKGDNISKHIVIKDIKPTFIIVKYRNKTKTVLLGDSI